MIKKHCEKSSLASSSTNLLLYCLKHLRAGLEMILRCGGSFLRQECFLMSKDFPSDWLPLGGAKRSGLYFRAAQPLVSEFRFSMSTTLS